MKRIIGTNESLKNLGVMIPQAKKIKFKTVCASHDTDMKAVIEGFVDRVIENPSTLEKK